VPRERIPRVIVVPSVHPQARLSASRTLTSLLWVRSGPFARSEGGGPCLGAAQCMRAARTGVRAGPGQI